MDANALSAANAYRNQLKLMRDAASGIVADDTPQASFSQMLKGVIDNTVDNQYKAEAVQMDSLTGNVDLSELVTAVTNAELTLNTVVAVRDRVINAYQEIIRMPI